MSRGAWFYRQASLTFTCDCLPGPPPSIPCTRGLPRAALVLGLRGGWGRPTLGKALTATLTSAPDSGCSRSQKQRKPFPQQAGHVTKSHLLPSGSLWRIFKTPVFGYKQSDACCVSHTHSQACGHTHEPAHTPSLALQCRWTAHASRDLLLGLSFLNDPASDGGGSRHVLHREPSGASDSSSGTLAPRPPPLWAAPGPQPHICFPHPRNSQGHTKQKVY